MCPIELRNISRARSQRKTIVIGELQTDRLQRDWARGQSTRHQFLVTITFSQCIAQCITAYITYNIAKFQVVHGIRYEIFHLENTPKRGGFRDGGNAEMTLFC